FLGRPAGKHGLVTQPGRSLNKQVICGTFLQRRGDGAVHFVPVRLEAPGDIMDLETTIEIKLIIHFVWVILQVGKDNIGSGRLCRHHTVEVRTGKGIKETGKIYDTEEKDHKVMQLEKSIIRTSRRLVVRRTDIRLFRKTGYITRDARF